MNFTLQMHIRGICFRESFYTTINAITWDIWLKCLLLYMVGASRCRISKPQPTAFPLPAYYKIFYVSKFSYLIMVDVFKFKVHQSNNISPGSKPRILKYWTMKYRPSVTDNDRIGRCEIVALNLFIIINNWTNLHTHKPTTFKRITREATLYTRPSLTSN